MKKQLLIVAVLLFATIQSSFAQEFWKMIEEGNHSIQEIQKSAESYFDQHGREKGSGYKQYKMWEYRALSESDTSGHILTQMEIEKQLAAFRKNQPKTKTLANTAVWTEIGPLKRNPTSSWNPGVGRVECLAVDPNNYNHILIGAPTGGAWKTTNNGTSWTPLTDFQDNLNMYSVEIDPNNSSTYFLGTNAGIYKSIDGGTSWTKVYNNNTIKKIKVKPDNSNIVIAATSGGILRSTNGGTSWTSVSSGSHYDLEFKPGTPNTVYACASGVVKYSTDGGATWTNSTGVSGSETRIAVTELDPNYLYVINSSATVFRSTNSGVSFTQTSGATPTDVFGGLSWYGMGFAVSNTNKNILLSGCFELYKSTDGGANFTKHISWTWSNNPTTYIHADIHAIEAVGAYFYTGTDGGIHKGSNEGNSYEDLTTGLGIRQFYCIGLSKSESGKVVGGAQDNGTAVLRTSDNKWYEFLGADGMEAFVDWNNANVLVGTSQNGSIYVSTNNGTSYSGKGKPGGIDGNWVTPMEQDPIDATKMYVGNTGLYVGTLPNLSSWTLVSNSPDGGKFTQIKIAPTNNNIFYVSTGSNLYKSTNKGVTWTSIYTGLSGSINNIAIDPNDANRVAVATSGSGKVYITTNGGTSWTSRLLNLPGLTAKAVVYKSGSEHGLYVGMSVGVYYIDDNLNSWQAYSDNLPNIAVYELEIDETGGMLYAGTYGRGLWRTPLYGTGVAAQKDVQLVSLSGTNASGCGLGLSPSVTIKNKGDETLNTLTIEVYLNNVLTSTINKTAMNLAKNASTSVSLGSITGINGNNSIKVVLSNVNGSADENPGDNETTVSSSLEDGIAHTFYIDEASKNSNLLWEIKKNSNTIKSSSNITPTSSSGVSSYNFCLVQGCYDITITNAFNSGSCLTPAWSANTIYVGDATNGAGLGEQVSYNGNTYRAQWWTQGNAPGTNSVWLLLGPCVTSIPTNKFGLKENQTPTTYFETTVANYTSPQTKQFCNGQSLTVDFGANNTNIYNCSNVTYTANITGGTGTTFSWNFGADASPATANTAGPHIVQYTTTGSKTISLTVDGITTTKTSYVNVTQDPNLTTAIDVQLTAGSNPACTGDQLTFTATPTNGGTAPSYTWYNGLNVVQTGSANTYSSSSLNNSDEIRCVLTSNKACVANTSATSSPITMVVDVCTNVESILKNEITLFPNPVLSQLTISSNLNNMVQYRIYNSLGQTMSMGNFTGNRKIDFSTYSSGIYFVELISGENKIIKQIVK